MIYEQFLNSKIKLAEKKGFEVLFSRALSFLLHAANRNIKGESDKFIQPFYKIKDLILRKYGKWIGYDVQHIRGKRCNSCDGRGNYPKYGYNGKIYDYADCYRCFSGWYKMPIWICLRRVQFGSHVFHQPLKREEHIGNPFTKESLGWEVSSNPVIEGYIEHKSHPFGKASIFILLWLYGEKELANVFLRNEIHWKKCRLKWKLREFATWSGWIFEKPKINVRAYYDENFIHAEDDLPF